MCHVRLIKAEGDGCGKGQIQQDKGKVDCATTPDSFARYLSSPSYSNYGEILYRTRFILSLLFLVGTIFINTSQSCASTHSVYIEQTPVNSGTVAPGTGIFQVGHQDRIKLRAIPKPGYRFLRWEGLTDDEDLTESETDAVIDTPKIIVAVFTREPMTQGGYTLLRPNFIPPGRGGSAPTFPDPEDTPKTPPIPEPATVALLSIGAVILRSRRQRKES